MESQQQPRRISASHGSLQTRLGLARRSLARIPTRLRKKRKRKSTLCGENPAALLLKAAFDQPAIDRAVVPIDGGDGLDEETSGSGEDELSIGESKRRLRNVLRDLQKCEQLIAEQAAKIPPDCGSRAMKPADFDRFAFVQLAHERFDERADAETLDVFFDALSVAPTSPRAARAAFSIDEREEAVDEANGSAVITPHSSSKFVLLARLFQLIDWLQMPARRTRIPARPSNSVNFLNVMKNCVGRDISKISFPVDFNEPLSALQRSVEELEAAQLLQAAAHAEDACRRLALVGVFAMSSYASCAHRTTKPFNPLLGETFECDRRDERGPGGGFFAVAEQVSHHPPCSTLCAMGSGWRLQQQYTPITRIKGRSLYVSPVGQTFVTFEQPNGEEETVSYNKLTTSTTMTNVLSGKLVTEIVGELVVRSDRSASEDAGRKVSGSVHDADGRVRFAIDGFRDQHATLKRLNARGEVESEEVVWTATPLPEDSALMHGFGRFAIELNEPPEPSASVPPTDSRFRIDQRAMEEADCGSGGELRLERGIEYKPLWFERKLPAEMRDEHDVYVFKEDEYFRCKRAADWSACPRIFDL
ncbi:Oxysterol-binding protein [Aphelenchoides fujianensis]|nr:Oxysterol-binding protein [Aphelenchoides fujianensis]